jgi:hypothetical protein
MVGSYRNYLIQKHVPEGARTVKPKSPAGQSKPTIDTPDGYGIIMA